jgi:hypothetical protein
VARQFVRRLAASDRTELRQAVPPLLDQDPYLSAWANIQAALGSAPPDDRERIQSLLAELDDRIEAIEIAPSLREAARRAVRGLLVRRWLLTTESLTFAYEPFESVIPLVSLNP